MIFSSNFSSIVDVATALPFSSIDYFWLRFLGVKLTGLIIIDLSGSFKSLCITWLYFLISLSIFSKFNLRLFFKYYFTFAFGVIAYLLLIGGLKYGRECLFLFRSRLWLSLDFELRTISLIVEFIQNSSLFLESF